MPKGSRFWCRVYGPSTPKAAPSLVVVEPAHVRRHIVGALNPQGGAFHW